MNLEVPLNTPSTDGPDGLKPRPENLYTLFSELQPIPPLMQEMQTQPEIELYPVLYQKLN